MRRFGSLFVAVAKDVTKEEVAPLFESRGDTRSWKSSTNTARALVAHLVRAEISPAENFHQCTVFFLTTEEDADADLRSLGPLLLFCSCVLVFAQTATAMAIFGGTVYPACKSNDFCEQPGTYCLLETSCGSHHHAPSSPG